MQTNGEEIGRLEGTVLGSLLDEAHVSWEESKKPYTTPIYVGAVPQSFFTRLVLKEDGGKKY